MSPSDPLSSPVDASGFAYVVGIDVSSQQAIYTVCQPDKRAVIKPTACSLDQAGMAHLDGTLRRLGVPPERLLIGLEATGRYYELKREVEWILGEALNSNHLYPALRRDEEMGAIIHEVERQSGRPDRHVYHLTKQGEQVLHTLLREFPAELAGNDREFQTRFAFFHLLDGASRLAILTTRRAVLLERLQHRQQALEALAGVCEQPQAAYAHSLLELHIRQIQQELEWIATHIQQVQP